MNFGSRKSTAERMADNVAQAAHAARDRSADSIAHAGDLVRDAATASEQQLITLGRQAQHASEEAYYAARDYSRQHPAVVVIAATALSAFIVYRLVSRRTRLRSGVRRIMPR